MRHAVLIFNPVAGQGDANADLENICQRLNPHFKLIVYQTSVETTAAALTKQAIQEGADLVIASGGDGTLSEVAGALLKTQIPIGVIARGTANAFSNALRIPLDITGACEAIISGKITPIDIAKVDISKVDFSENKLTNTLDYTEGSNSHVDFEDTYPLLLLAGIGFEAATIEGADRESKNRLGGLAYLMSALKQLQNLELFQVELETAERIISCSASAITIANAAPATSVLAQGPAKVAYNDGLLDITIFAPTTALGVIVASYHLLQTALQSQAAAREDIGYFKTKALTIRTEPPQKVVVDGEVIGTTPIRVECIPAGLTVILPDSAVEADPIERLEGLPDLKIQIKGEELSV
jgi:YegS/Rv2252/BmrU family lipid kinase